METIESFVVFGLVMFAMTAGCGDSTELVVYVDTDLALGNEIMTIEVSAGSIPDSHSFEITSATEMPLVFSIGPKGSVDDDIPIRIAALDDVGNPIVVWEAVTQFRSGRSLEIPAPLARSCIGGAECDADTTCRNGTCEPLFIDPADLEPSGTHEGRIFEGPSEPMVAPSCESRAADGEACRPACPCVDRVMCVTGALTCEPGPEGVEEGCERDGTMLPYEGTSAEELGAFEMMCRELAGAICQSEGRACP